MAGTRGQRAEGAIVLAGVLLALGDQASAAPEASDPRLSATLVGRLEPGTTGRLAVRWNGPPGALLDAWVDLDGDGQRAPGEMVADGHPLASGIEVLSFDLAPAAQVVPEPRVWVTARAADAREAKEAGGAGASVESRDGCAWQPGFTVADVDERPRAMSVFDDGSGPALYVGGRFTIAGGVTVNHIARWDGSTWSPLSGSSVAGTSDYVSTLAVFDDGSGPALYAGGYFTTAGGVTVNRIARWDGNVWSALDGPSGAGVSEQVDALAVFDDGSGHALYAGGWFESAGGLPSTHIAAWRCPDTTSPSNPTSLASTTHTPGAWSPANVIAVEWSGAIDSGGSRLAGYSVLFDTSRATVPDTTVDVPQGADPHSTSSAILADFPSYWFHLRTCDHAGNCSAGVHLGPFRVDATPPSGPFDLTSTSHTPGVPSEDRTVDLTWNPALDPGSGLDGYAWAVTAASTWACDQVKDLEEGATSLTTPKLADNPWYVHLCATDSVGNWGDVVSAGPYLVGALFADGFEEGDTAGWAYAEP